MHGAAVLCRIMFEEMLCKHRNIGSLAISRDDSRDIPDTVGEFGIAIPLGLENPYALS